MSIPFTVDIAYQGLDYKVSGTYTPGTPDVFYLSNGDPGYPGDPAEVEFTSIIKHDGDLVLELTQAEAAEVWEDVKFYDLVIEAADQSAQDDFDAKGDWEYERQKDLRDD